MNIAVNAAALVVAPSIALSGDSDAEAIEAGKRFEKLFVTYMPAWLEWTRLARQAKQEAFAKFGSDYRSPAWSKPLSGQSPATLFHAEVCRLIGTDRASERMTRIYDEMDPLAEQIRNAEIQSVEGLRSKVLVAMWEAQPLCATHSGELEFHHEDDFRSLLAGAVAVTGLSDFFAAYVEQIEADGTAEVEHTHAAPSAAAEPDSDPIFAAIERHKLAYERHVASLGEDELEAAIPQERRRSSFHDAMFGDEDWRVPTDDPAWIAHIEESCSARETETDAAIALVSSENLTRAGATALLQYASDLEAKDSKCWPDELFDDDDGKRRSWHFFLMKQVASALEA